MELNKEQRKLLNKWLQDPTFREWANQSNLANFHRWERYLGNNPQFREVAEIGRLLVEGVEFSPSVVDPEIGQQALARLRTTLRQEKILPHESSSSPKRYRANFNRWAVAASFLIMVSLCTVLYFQFFRNTLVVIATNFGEQQTTILPDGTKVSLNANSTLKFDKREPRSVSLAGEAFFEVQKKPATNAVFEVHTSDLSVLVLGTSFNVNTRNERTQVFLEEGKVKLNVKDLEQPSIEMDPGDLVAYSKKLNRLQENKKGISGLEVASWKSGILQFNDTPLLTALLEIEHVYGIHFEIRADNLEKETLSGGVPSNDLETTLNALRDIYGLQFKLEGKTYLISGKK